MKTTFNTHVRNDRAKWIITALALLIVGVLLCGIITNWFKEMNPFCWFGHNYDEANVCTRCGAEKPVEEEKQPNEPQGFISEPVTMFASAKRLNVSNGIAAQADIPSYIPSGYVLMRTPYEIKDYQVGIIFELPSSNYHDWTHFELLQCATFAVHCYYYYDQSGVSLHFSMSHEDTDDDCDNVNNYYGFTDSIMPGSAYKAGNKLVVALCIADIDDGLDRPSGFNTILDLYENIYVEADIQALPADPVKEGYTFTGWYTDNACTNKYTEDYVTSDITLYAGFRAHEYSIKFNANSGSGEMSNIAMTYDKAKVLTANSFTKDHYAFKGWATSPDGAVVYTDKQSVKNLTATDGATVELFAIWERSEVKVDFVSEGTTTTTWIAIGTKATLPENPVKEGHNFVGWYLADGTQYTTQNLSEDTVLTAKFKIIRCTVTFIVDGEVYATYVCDWGTKLSEALNANDVNPVLMSVEGEYSRNF